MNDLTVIELVLVPYQREYLQDSSSSSKISRLFSLWSGACRSLPKTGNSNPLIVHRDEWTYSRIPFDLDACIKRS